MQIITAYATRNPCYKAAKALTPKGIVVHSTGANNPHLKRYVDAPAAVGRNTYGNHWNTENTQVCVHAFIGYDINKKVAVANILPYNIRCWGVGSGSKGSFNSSHIQFEICEDNLTDASYFRKVWDVAVEYCAYLCNEYGFNPLGENVIVGHFEAHKLGYGSNHADPGHWFNKYGKTMDDFRKAVRAKISGAVAVSPSDDKSIIYRVQVGAYAHKPNANAMLAKLKAKGYDTMLVQIGGVYKVQVGAYSNRANAENVSAKLKRDGFGAMIVQSGGNAVADAPASKISVGSSVKLKQGAKAYTGQTLQDYVYNRVHVVSQLNGDRAVITYKGVIVAAVRVDDLMLA